MWAQELNINLIKSILIFDQEDKAKNINIHIPVTYHNICFENLG